MRVACPVEWERLGHDGLDRAVGEQFRQRRRPARGRPGDSSQSVSRLRPITDFEALICLIMLKRGICSAVLAAATRYRRSPDTTAEAPKQTCRPPARSRL